MDAGWWVLKVFLHSTLWKKPKQLHLNEHFSLLLLQWISNLWDIYTTQFSTKKRKLCMRLGRSFIRQWRFVGLKTQTFEKRYIIISVQTIKTQILENLKIILRNIYRHYGMSSFYILQSSIYILRQMNHLDTKIWMRWIPALWKQTLNIR